MNTVFLLWHIHVLNGEDDEKLIGVYSSELEAKNAIARVADQPGFRDTPDGFEICGYELNTDHWREGFVTGEAES